MPDRLTAPATRPFDRLQLPVPTVETLKNGITFHHYNGGNERICRLSVKIPFSSLSTDKAVASLLATQLTEGSSIHLPEVFSEILDFNGATISAHASGYYINVNLNILTDRLPEFVPVFAEVFDRPAFCDDRLENAKLAAVDNLLTARRNPAIIANEALRPLVYGKQHPASKRTLPDDIMAVSTDILRQHFTAMLNPAKMHVMLAGGLDYNTLDRVRNAFENLSAHGPGFDTPHFSLESAHGGTRVVTPFEDSLQSALVMAIICPDRSHPDYIALRLAVMALGGYFGSRLMSNIREEKGLTYGIDAALQGLREGSFTVICAKCDKSFTAEVESETVKELLRLQSDPPSGEELERLKLYAMTSLAKTLDTPMNIMGYYGGRLEAAYPTDYFNKQQTVIENLTAADISTMAARYLRPENIIYSIAGA